MTVDDAPELRRTFRAFSIEAAEVSYFIGEHGKPAGEFIVTPAG